VVSAAFRALSVLAIALALIVGNSAPSDASHSWGGYHWARTSNPFTIQLGDNMSASWDVHLSKASSDWSQSTVLDTVGVAGEARGNCRPRSGRVEVCDRSYGYNGWLGLAQIWIIDGTHITQGAVKLNDTYFALAQYNNSSEKQHVVCQEVGHTFGLDHQSTSGASLNTCMDYYHNTSDQDTKSTSPNQHDYDQLATIYAHLDSYTTVTAPAAVAQGAPGRAAEDGTPAGASRERGSWYAEDLGGGRHLITHVYWTDQGR
jgi:hypothetical protein